MTVGSIIRHAVFMVIESKVSYDLLLGQRVDPWYIGCTIIAPSKDCNMEE